MDREPVVAGQFYPADKEKLRALVAGFVPPGERRKAIGVMSPHAGYVYSGSVAGRTFAQVEVPERVLILGPNHQGLGHRAALYPAGAWRTPLGRVAVDAVLSQKLLEKCPRLAEDALAHRLEHSLEVQVPFLQYLNPQLRIAAICLGRLGLSELLALGRSIGECLHGAGEEILVVASTDMTHYESAERARVKDMAAIERILALDPEGLYQVVSSRNISMCGVLPTVVMLEACRHRGATSACLVQYTNSGEVSGDDRQVVGYAGVVVS
ncbi:AmmeMemoRadiSam system protein B [Geoalkalibacter sp.]|uniref:AmmeMemoRadiSam system protein B n=1 Tax=Geoalkalibacter sp. TaxID=3041440 RepID=UPI00272E48DB|nr:AmmeMemoRadiSam system protein B [Geoalkalibacter sp.]